MFEPTLVRFRTQFSFQTVDCSMQYKSGAKSSHRSVHYFYNSLGCHQIKEQQEFQFL